MTKLIVAFRNFANALNKICCLAQHCRADVTVMLQYLSVKNHAVGYSIDVFCTPSVSQYIKECSMGSTLTRYPLSDKFVLRVRNFV
jgi:hypothetical protein